MGITRSEVRQHLREPRATYESLVEDTGIASRCTACRLDLDLLLEELHQQRARTYPDHRNSKDASALLARPQDLSDAGFIYNRDGIETILRIDNRGLLFDDTSHAVDFRYSLRVFDAAGKLVHRERGNLAVEQELEVNFSQLETCPPTGWFLVSIYPRSTGLVGTTRPQLVIKGPDWVSSVHTQWLSMSCRFKAALVRTREGQTHSLVSLINAVAAKTTTTLELESTLADFHQSNSITLPPMGSRIVALDEMFSRLPKETNLRIAVGSDRPVSKHLILCHSDGSWSQNHFPNLK